MKKVVKKVNKPKASAKKKAEKKKPKLKTTKKSPSKKTTTKKKKEEKKTPKKKLVVKNPLRDKKVLKEVIQQSTKASEVKNDVIAKKEELKRKIEQFQEDIRNARENGEEACDISNMIIECNRYRDELQKLEREAL